MRLDQDDRRVLVGVAVLSAGVVWAAVVVGLAVAVVRLIGGV